MTGADDEAAEARYLETGRLLFSKPVDFVTGVAGLDGLPPADRPEFAFAGRSNVGKSSLINALTNRKDLARTSNTPGRTQQLNFFSLPAGDPDGIYLVDLPGYGYAREAKSKVAAWTKLIVRYLSGRPSLKRVYVLIDARHGVKANDEEIFELLDTAAVSYQAVLTKCDKPRKGELAAVEAETANAMRAHVAAHPEVISTSSREGAGMDRLRAEIAALAER